MCCVEVRLMVLHIVAARCLLLLGWLAAHGPWLDVETHSSTDSQVRHAFQWWWCCKPRCDTAFRVAYRGRPFLGLLFRVCGCVFGTCSRFILWTRKKPRKHRNHRKPQLVPVLFCGRDRTSLCVRNSSPFYFCAVCCVIARVTTHRERGGGRGGALSRQLAH